MTFAKQIEGVPMELVRQGWRLQSSNEFDSDWRRQSPANRWDYEAIEVDGAYLDIARPVIEPANGPRVYAHQGWGDELAPLPEMVKVWPFWWISIGNGLMPVTVVFHDKTMAVDGLSIRYIGMHKWFGPVLPPVLPTVVL